MRIAGLKSHKLSAKQKRERATKRREATIAKILAKVSEICDYAIENLCTQQAQFEELEMMLNDCIK